MKLREESMKAASFNEVAKTLSNFLSYDPDVPLAKPKNRWQDKAACKGVENAQNIFLPNHSLHYTRRPADWPYYDELYREAKGYCMACPVKDICLEEAIAEEGHYPIGMRGGKNHVERYEMYQERRDQGRFIKRKIIKPKPTERGIT